MKENISGKLNIINNAKNNIKTAIEGKGVAVGNVGIQEYAEKINSIQSGVPDEIEELIESFKSSCDGTLGSKCTKLPDGITKIGAHAFRYCTNIALTELPNTVTEISNMSFASATGLQLSKLPDSLVKIDNQAFQSCSDLALTELPDALTTLGTSAFAGCSNIKIKEIPSGVTKIPDTCFQNCSSITELTILGNVTSIGYESISRCTSLSKITFPNITSVPSSSSNTWLFNSPIANGSGYIYVPDDLVEATKTKTNWTQYANQIKGLSELPTE